MHPRRTLGLLAASGAAIASAMLVATPARAELRTGGYFRAALGAAYGEGAIHYADASRPTGKAPARSLSFATPFTSGAVGADLAAGFAPTSGLAIAIEYGLLAQDLGDTAFPHTTLSTLLLSHVGPLVDWYPDASGPMHLEVGAGYAWGGFSGDESGVPADDNVVRMDDLNRSRGLFGQIGCGYVVRVGGFDLGPLLRTYATRLASPHGETDSVGFGLWLTATSL